MESRFYFAEKYLDVVRTAENEWVLWYLPKRTDVSLFGAYVAIAFAGNVFQAPDSRKYYMTLSKFEKLDPPVRAVSPEVIYEKGFAEPERKATEQRTARPLPDQEFVNILADHIIGANEQSHFSTPNDSAEERARKMAVLADLVQTTKERISRTFPQRR